MQDTYPIPFVISNKDRILDIYSFLLRERIIFLQETTEQSANLIVSQLLYLERDDSEKDISLYLNHGGGNAYAGLAIIDTMRTIRPDISTVAVGFAASMGAVILCAGAKGKRYALPNSTIMMHQARFLSEIRGPATDIAIQAAEMKRVEDKIINIISIQTGQSLEKVIRDTERDFYLNPEQAVEYGIIDSILHGKKISS
jgi:ATP-dependent Clp protease protease subunit